MSQASSIEWTDATWNPVRGCSRVSEGCRNCYAERVAARFSGQGLDGSTPPESHFQDGGRLYARAAPFWRFAEQTKAGPRWTGRVELVPEKLDEPLRWRKPRKVFVNSMSDLFHERLSFESIAAVFGVMAAAPQHTFQVLTKRPERMAGFFSLVDAMTAGRGRFVVPALIEHAAALAGGSDRLFCAANRFAGNRQWPLLNVWLGTSVENQETADERIPHLLATPATGRFVSYEPALGPVDFSAIESGRGRIDALCGIDFECIGDIGDGGRLGVGQPERGLDWIIVGGESGPGARPFDIAWARSTVAQCREAGVACFVKQLGADPFFSTFDDEPNGGGQWPVPLEWSGHGVGTGRPCLRDRKGGDMREWPEDLRVREFPR